MPRRSSPPPRRRGAGGRSARVGRAGRPPWRDGWRRFLDVTVDPMITCKTPGAGGDILRDSVNNLYVGVGWPISRASRSAIR